MNSPFLLGSIVTALLLITGCKAASDCQNDVWAIIKANKGNKTALHNIDAPSWVSASEFRGTMDILQSCLLTLIASIYTALHLNVPTDTNFLSIQILKVKWVLLALLAPEIVLYTAAYQFIQALKLKRRLNTLQAKSKLADKNFIFDLKYAFFVVMGGVRIKTADLASIISLPDANDDSMYWKLYDMTTEKTSSFQLTASGISHLAERDCWIYISRSKIDDKSKADYIQKALVLLQVSWMACQCIARHLYGLPLTLLEIHTIVHVMCAIGLYACWLSKPLNVQDPELVFDETWLGPLAVMIEKFAYRLQLGRIIKYRGQTNNKFADYLRVRDRPLSPQISPDRMYESRYGTSKTHILPAGEALECELGRGQIDMSPLYDQRFDLTAEAVKRWNLIAHELDNGCWPESLGNRSVQELVLRGWASDWGEQPALSIQTSNLTGLNTTDLSTLHDKLGTVLGFPHLFALATLLPALYGGIHLTAWHFDFPTDIEHLLWKIACLDIMITFPLAVCVALLVVWILNRLNYPEQSHAASIGDGIYDFIGVMLLACYIFARAYILLEAFISLRKVPIGVYWIPAWAQMIPHV